MSLGFVVGESKPTFVTAITSRALSVGEYIKIGSVEGEILGLVERSSVSSAALLMSKILMKQWRVRKLQNSTKETKHLLHILGF